MPRVSTGLFLLVLAACPPQRPPNPPPTDQFYFPTGLVHADSPSSPDGVLYVSSSNFDRHFDRGAVIALDLSKVGDGGHGLPPFGDPVGPNGPKQIPELNIQPSSVVGV